MERTQTPSKTGFKYTIVVQLYDMVSRDQETLC